MRKRIIAKISRDSEPPDQEWLRVENLAQVEVTSEDVANPIESALVPGAGGNWRAAQPGEQTIRIVFDQPQRLNRIRLVFEENEVERSQEFVLRWSPDNGRTYRDIVRQQWNFSLPGSGKEIEDYRVDLSDVTVLELQIAPDRGGGEVLASLSQLRLA